MKKSIQVSTDFCSNTNFLTQCHIWNAWDEIKLTRKFTVQLATVFSQRLGGRKFTFNWLQFALKVSDGTLTRKNLLPYWEQILSCMSAISQINGWRAYRSQSILFYSTPFHVLPIQGSQVWSSASMVFRTIETLNKGPVHVWPLCW